MLTVKSLLKHPAPIPLALARETYPALRPVTSCRTIPCASYSYHLSQLRRWPTSWDSPTCWARIGKDAPHTEVVFLGTQETLQRTQQKTLQTDKRQNGSYQKGSTEWLFPKDKPLFSSKHQVEISEQRHKGKSHIDQGCSRREPATRRSAQVREWYIKKNFPQIYLGNSGFLKVLSSY